MTVLKTQEIYILENLQDKAILRSELINLIQDNIYPNEHHDEKKLKIKLRKSISKLTGSGCVQIIPNIFAQDGRESIYKLTEKGREVFEHIKTNNIEVYSL